MNNGVFWYCVWLTAMDRLYDIYRCFNHNKSIVVLKRAITSLCLAMLIVATLDATADAVPAPCRSLLPEKIAAIYSGWYGVEPKGEKKDIEEQEKYLDAMAGAGFNTFYMKFQPMQSRPNIDLSDPAQFAQVRQFSEACQKRGLALVAYTYHYPLGGRNGARWPESLAYAPLVRGDGVIKEDVFALANDDTWRFITGAVFELARASLKLPIVAVGFDHECLDFSVSYDDQAWKSFAGRYGLDLSLTPDKRGPLVAAQGLRDTYNSWYYARWDGVIKRWVEEIHAINPYLSIAFMPYRGTSFDRPLLTQAGTEKAPCLVDCWQMYNGGGLTEQILRLRDKIKVDNPHNRCIQWLRPDSYGLEDIRIQSYHALWQLDGYCNWHIGQITSAKNPAGYWQSYGDANRLALSDLAAKKGEPTIPLVPVTPLVARMPTLDEPVPQLATSGDGSGSDCWIPMRNLQQVLIHADAGENLMGEIRHLAGLRRPIALQYKLARPDGSWLYDNSVMPGKTEKFEVRAPETGTYALYVTGGEGGQAWYAVRIHNLWHVVSFKFGDPYLFFEKSLFPLTLWLRRSEPEASASITVRGSGIKAQVSNEKAHAGKELSLNIPAGDQPISIRFSRPEPDDITESEDTGGTWYVQNIYLSVNGAVFPYLGVAPERMLTPQ